MVRSQQLLMLIRLQSCCCPVFHGRGGLWLLAKLAEKFTLQERHLVCTHPGQHAFPLFMMPFRSLLISVTSFHVLFDLRIRHQACLHRSAVTDQKLVPAVA